MRVLTVVGARPQFIKAAPLAHALREAGVEEAILHTGQHYDPNMSDVFFEELEIPPPAFHLGVGSGSHGVQTARMIEAIEAVLLRERPHALVVYGDTNSTLAGALAAAKLHIPVAHVEAGLRSFNRRMPEEVNRVLTDHASDLLLTPTPQATANLRDEGVPQARVVEVGDVMYDAALRFAPRADARDLLPRLQLQPRGYVLATLHRAENTDDPSRLGALLDALGALHNDLPVVLPLHPRTRAALQRLGRLDDAQRALRLIEPVGYLDMLALERGAALVATDSGGVQKEAFFARVPCVTLRDETEWVELIDLGWNRLASPALGADALLRRLRNALERGEGTPPPPDLYGGGRAAGRIAQALLALEPHAAS